MSRSTSSSPFLHRARYPLALVLGLFLGQAVALMAQREGNSIVGFVVAALFTASASASFVLFALSSQQHFTANTEALSRRAHSLVGWIGLGLLLSLRAPELLV